MRPDGPVVRETYELTEDLLDCVSLDAISEPLVEPSVYGFVSLHHVFGNDVDEVGPSVGMASPVCRIVLWALGWHRLDLAGHGPREL